MTVIILAAGRGTRMGQLSLPKCLLPYKGKAIIGHVVEAWFLTEFIVVVPQNDVLIESYLRAAYPKVSFKFVQVPDDEVSRGPLWSLQLALQVLPADEVISFTVADGVYSMSQQLLTILQGDWRQPVESNNYLGVTYKSVDEQKDYLNVQERPHDQLLFLEKREGNGNYQSWAGVAVISSRLEFRDRLTNVLDTYENTDAEAPWTLLWKKFAEVAWLGLFDQPFLDLGTEARYTAVTKQEEKGFDYSKPDQIVYQNHKTNRVVKYWADEREASKWSRRHASLLFNGARYILPEGVTHHHNFVGYEYVTGKTLASSPLSGDEFRTILSTLHRQLWWTPKHKPLDRFSNPSTDLYFRKTLARVQQYLSKQAEPTTHMPAGWLSLLKEAFWYQVKRPVIGNVHGDLTLDNIVRQPNGTFTLIDWRTQVVSGSACSEGDVYYDLAKLWLSIEIDLEAVKLGEFSANHIPSVKNKDELHSVLQSWCEQHDFSYQETVRYAILMMAAMCAVHQQPLASALYAKSLGMAWKFMRDVKCFNPIQANKASQETK